MAWLAPLRTWAAARVAGGMIATAPPVKVPAGFPVDGSAGAPRLDDGAGFVSVA